ncbi:BTB/POZ domain-containing protein 19 isoform X3 [Ursus americanus]|uniref:BTB/POZ domain-containing protein 19 isoform X3 n=1 Tax=Ursus americanus TaxID=9643 RepID=UPI001E679183|nr:BTB/POZ domain-containing protein 19 isoform X3 [Ursus americanus]
MADLWLEGLRPVPYMTDLEMKAQNGQRQSLRVVPQDRPLLPCFSPPLSHSDVCFVVGQERQEVFAHRCLLACRCNFFQRLLGPKLGPGMPSPVVLSTVPAEAFLAVLEFLYTNSVRLHRHSVLEVLTAAVEYGLEELREVAVTFGLGPLQERCIAFIEAHSQVSLPIFTLPNPHTSFCSSLTRSWTHRRRSGPAASWSCQRPRCCPCCAATSCVWTRLSSSWLPGAGRAWARPTSWRSLQMPDRHFRLSSKLSCLLIFPKFCPHRVSHVRGCLSQKPASQPCLTPLSHICLRWLPPSKRLRGSRMCQPKTRLFGLRVILNGLF